MEEIGKEMEKKKKRQRKRKKKRTFVKGRRCFLEWNVVVYGSRPKAKRYSRDRQTEVNLTFFFLLLSCVSG